MGRKMIKRAVDSATKHKIYCISCNNIEWITKLLLDGRRLVCVQGRHLLVPGQNNRKRGVCLKGRVLPRQKAIDQLNVTDCIIHNIAPCPQLCGHHTGGQ